MPNLTLNALGIDAYFDETSKIVFVKYLGELTLGINAKVYEWFGELLQEIGIENSNGSIYDFSEVTSFALGNAITVKKNSEKISKEDPKVVNHPVALIVKTPAQRQAVQSIMAITPDHKRKKIVNSLSAAYQFIEEFHGTRTTK